MHHVTPPIVSEQSVPILCPFHANSTWNVEFPWNGCTESAFSEGVRHFPQRLNRGTRCNASPAFSAMPDVAPSDNHTVTRYSTSYDDHRNDMHSIACQQHCHLTPQVKKWPQTGRIRGIRPIGEETSGKKAETG